MNFVNYRPNLNQKLHPTWIRDRIFPTVVSGNDVKTFKFPNTYSEQMHFIEIANKMKGIWVRFWLHFVNDHCRKLIIADNNN